MRIARDDWASTRLMRDRRSPRKGKPGSAKGGHPGGPQRRQRPPGLDPEPRRRRRPARPRGAAARRSCSSSAGSAATPPCTQCLNAGVRLTSPEERDEIYAYVEAACRDLPDEDLHVLGYHDFLDGLTRGVAAHHAGMLPAFKQVVEELFVRGLCKVVFATETLALGINMPARTVVIEKLTKWNGETHADITPGEYTQLTGRAGRRGLDVEGHGVVLWQPGMNPREVAGLASTRTYPLRSSFRPSYNMAVNLVHQFGRETSRELLEQSFAQFQADKAVVGLARQLRKSEEALEGYREAAHLPPRRLHGVRRAAPPDQRRSRRAPARPSAPTAARRRSSRCATLKPRRRDRGADRQVRRLRRGHRPRLGAERTRGRTSSPPTGRPGGWR